MPSRIITCRILSFGSQPVTSYNFPGILLVERLIMCCQVISIQVVMKSPARVEGKVKRVLAYCRIVVREESIEARLLKPLAVCI